MHSSPSPAELNTWLALNIGRSFDVVLAGNVLGGRYGESPQKLKQATLEVETLRINFNTTELMIVVNPSGVSFEKNGLLVKNAAEVVFSWHSYGTEANAENWRAIHCRADGSHVCIERLNSTRTEYEFAVPTPEYLVQLVCSDA
jgi:hypothetical protein